MASESVSNTERVSFEGISECISRNHSPSRVLSFRTTVDLLPQACLCPSFLMSSRSSRSALVFRTHLQMMTSSALSIRSRSFVRSIFATIRSVVLFCVDWYFRCFHLDVHSNFARSRSSHVCLCYNISRYDTQTCRLLEMSDECLSGFGVC